MLFGVPTGCLQRDERVGLTGNLDSFTSSVTNMVDCTGIVRGWLRDVARVAETGCRSADGRLNVLGGHGLVGRCGNRCTWKSYRDHGSCVEYRKHE